MDVTPDKQNIDTVFSNTTYFIDFYQRHYKWNDEPVKRLLDDIFYKFNAEYDKYKDLDIELDKVIDKYGWYYLNTYVTNQIEGKIYVVDGQQRLTTLTLILIKLRHMALHLKSDLEKWISNKIAGQSGFKEEFWMNHEMHKETLKHLFDGKQIDKIGTSSGITAVNMVNNYQMISSYIDSEIKDKHKFETYVFFILRRLVLINLNVEQTDVPMVFEVINDRGVRLKPYEILKGKLLGQIDKEELSHLKLNELWEKQVKIINDFKDDEIDNFFIYYLRSRYANTIGDSRKFDKGYHRVIFLPEINDDLKLLHNPKSVKSFLQNQFVYYSSLYAKIYSYYKNPDKDYIHVYYNSLTEMDSQFLLILSACNINDELENEKIKLVSREVDRLFCLLQLQRSYDSNDFNETIYQINKSIRGQGLNEIKKTFNEQAIQLLSEARGIAAKEELSYSFFKETGIELDRRFKRYFFARIEEFIAENTNLKMKNSLYDLVANTGAINGFHIEHILAQNDDNYAEFGNNKENFEKERNRLGGLLLLKGRDNISSNNESYADKLKTYANTLYWNETLREDSYKSKLDFSNMISKYKLNFRPLKKYGPDELEERHRLLFDMIKIIWGNV